MAKLGILRMGDPRLLAKAAPVDDPSDPAIQRLVDDMVETMEAADGAGLAAPQVGVALRLVIFRVPPARDDAGETGVPLTVLINPEIEMLGEEWQHAWEGCLSLPGLLGRVARCRRIRYRGLDRDGAPVDRVAEGFHARVVQHECDHLDGILYPMRLDDPAEFGFVEELREAFTR